MCIIIATIAGPGAPCLAHAGHPGPEQVQRVPRRPHPGAAPQDQRGPQGEGGGARAEATGVREDDGGAAQEGQMCCFC